jgi:Protein of unknown function (DUF3105)
VSSLPRVTRALALALALVLAAAGCSGDSSDESSSDPTGTPAAEPEVLPDGGRVPTPRIKSLAPAARDAKCELSTTTARSRDHIVDIEQTVDYDTNPPTTGKHYQVAAEDGLYEEAAPDTAVVHSHEHGRVVFWFRPSLPREARAGLRALVEEDGYQMLLMPRSEMPFEVAATAWNRSPGREGTGRLLGCRGFSPAAYDALRAFRDENRGRGPEAIP